MSEIKLTPKQQAFADYYIKSANASEAAVKAGYSENTAGVIGYENLKKPQIAKYIEERANSIKSSRIADMEEVREFWSGLLRSPDAETKDRLKASEYIAKTNGAFLDKVEHSGKIQTKDPVAELTTEELRRILEK